MDDGGGGGWFRVRERSAIRQPRLGLALGAATVVLGAFVPHGTVSAHATVDSIAPADGTLLSIAPDDVRIDFSEPISGEFIEVEVVTSTSTVHGELTGRRDPADPTALVITLPVLDDGSYQIGFSVRDEIDLHEVRGRTSFTIGDHAVVRASPPLVSGPQPFETPARWAFAAGVALLAGSLVLRRRWLDLPPTAMRRLAWCTGAGALLVFTGRIGVIAARAADLGTGWSTALSAVARTDDVTRLPVFVSALACLVPLLLPRRWPWLDTSLRSGWDTSCRIVVAWSGIVWLALLAGWGDHAALSGSVEVGIALAKTAHLIGLGVWVGTLAVTLLVTAGSGQTSTTLRASGRIAVTGAVITVVSGLVLAARTVVSVTGALATPFGQMLVVKLGLVALAVAIALGRRRSGAVRRSTVEAVLLGTVVSLGAAMATAGPATDDAYKPAPADAAPGTMTSPIGDVIVRVRAVPGRPGSNDLEITVAQTRRPAVALESVRIDIDTPAGPQHWTVHPDGRGATVVPAVELPEGTSDLAVAVARAGLPEVTGSSSVATAVPSYHHPAIVSSQPIAGVLHAAALAIGLVAALSLLASLNRRQVAVAARMAVHDRSPVD